MKFSNEQKAFSALNFKVLTKGPSKFSPTLSLAEKLLLHIFAKKRQAQEPLSCEKPFLSNEFNGACDPATLPSILSLTVCHSLTLSSLSLSLPLA